MHARFWLRGHDDSVWLGRRVMRGPAGYTEYNSKKALAIGPLEGQKNRERINSEILTAIF